MKARDVMAQLPDAGDVYSDLLKVRGRARVRFLSIDHIAAFLMGVAWALEQIPDDVDAGLLVGVRRAPGLGSGCDEVYFNGAHVDHIRTGVSASRVGDSGFGKSRGTWPFCGIVTPIKKGAKGEQGSILGVERFKARMSPFEWRLQLDSLRERGWTASGGVWRPAGCDVIPEHPGIERKTDGTQRPDPNQPAAPATARSIIDAHARVLHDGESADVTLPDGSMVRVTREGVEEYVDD